MAAASGRVTLAGVYRDYGNCVIIDHGNGLSTLYAHASKLCVSVGEYVSAGEVIALVGSTGNSTGNHLHFEVYPPGKDVDGWSKNAIDPETVLP
jgi:murein DD-endopeptidase MepM/ murein hydrolase activator NlpD